MAEPLALAADPETAAPALAAAPGPAPADPGARLAAEAARIAGRLAALLRRAVPADDGALGAGIEFLERAARAAEGADSGDTAACRPADSDHPLDRVADRYALSPFEVDLVLLAGLGEEHEGFADVLRSLHPQGRPFATVGLAAQLLAPGAAERRALRRAVETGPARRAGIFDLDGDGPPSGPLFGRSVVLAEALWSALAGIDAWPARLAPEPAPPPAAWGLARWLATPAAGRAARTLAGGRAVTVLVTAEDAETAAERAAALAEAAGVAAIPLALPAGEPAPALVRLAGLHAVARGAVPLFRAAVPENGGPALLPRLDEHPGPALVAAPAGAARLRGHRPLVAVPCDRLGPSDLGRMWAGALPDLAAEAPLLAARYPLEPAAAREVAADLDHGARLAGRRPGLAEVAEAVRARSGAVVGGAVRLVRPAATWDRLVLPAAKLAQLREAVDRLLHQRRVLDDWRVLAGRPGARGVRALLAGPPGTGKSFSAEVLAGELAVDLLVVDLSRVVSKWIGETEKNLADVFAAAEQARAVLLFDEADALFGKRTEVSDAHDRYANLETAYLLSRLERFEGLALLATNLRQNIDPAFTRRLEFVVDFDEPGREERLALWRGHLPESAPLAADVSLAEIAGAYPLVGGLIKNAAAAAAFLAAAGGGPIGRDHLLHAIHREYQKAGKAFPGPPRGAAGATPPAAPANAS